MSGTTAASTGSTHDALANNKHADTDVATSTVYVNFSLSTNSDDLLQVNVTASPNYPSAAGSIEPPRQSMSDLQMVESKEEEKETVKEEEEEETKQAPLQPVAIHTVSIANVAVALDGPPSSSSSPSPTHSDSSSASIHDHALEVDERLPPNPVQDAPAHMVTIHNVNIISFDNINRPPPEFRPLTAEPEQPAAVIIDMNQEPTDEIVPRVAVSTREIKPLSSPKIWKSVPHECVSLVASYLDAQSLTRFSRIDSLCNTLASKKDLWMRLVSRPWNGDVLLGARIGAPNLNGVSRETQTKQYYAERYRVAVGKMNSDMENWRRDVQQVHRKRRGIRCHYMCDGCMPFLLGLMLPLFTIFLVYQLVHGQTIDIFTFWPLFAFGGLIGLSACMVCCAKYCSGDHQAGSCFGLIPSNFYDESGALVKDGMELIWNGNSRRGHVTFCMMLCVLLLFVVFLCLKISGQVDWDWWIVFCPLYVVFFSFLFAPWLRWPATSRVKISPCITVWAALGAPLLCFTLLLNIWLHQEENGGHHFRLMFVMIPLFGLDFLTLVALFFGILDAIDDESCSTAFGYILLWLFTDGPMVAFKILIAYNVDSAIGWNFAYIFIPFFVSVLTTLIAALAYTFEKMSDKGFDAYPGYAPPRPYVVKPTV